MALILPDGSQEFPVLACILQLQTTFTTIGIGVTFWAILNISVAVIRIQEAESKAPDGYR